MPRISSPWGKYILQIRQRGSGLFRQNDYLYQRCRRQCDPEEGRKLAERFSCQYDIRAASSLTAL